MTDQTRAVLHRQAAASLVNGRFQAFPSGRTATYHGIDEGGSRPASKPLTIVLILFHLSQRLYEQTSVIFTVNLAFGE